MPRLKAAVQARKETALESLRDALRTTGRLIRPRLGCPGYGAVRVALAHWRPDFDDAPEKERLALLRAATQWDVERNSKARPHARMDVERHASLTRELVEWLKAPEAAAAAAAAARATSRRHAWGGGGQRKRRVHRLGRGLNYPLLPIHEAARYWDVDQIQELISKGVNPDALCRRE